METPVLESLASEGETVHLMGMSALALRRTSLFLLVAFLHAMLAPSVGLAAGRESVARTVLLQLCGATGHQSIEFQVADAGDKSGTVSSSKPAGICLLCFSPATLPPVGLPACAPAGHAFVPTSIADDPEPRRVAVWNPSLARAPPAGI